MNAAENRISTVSSMRPLDAMTSLAFTPGQHVLGEVVRTAAIADEQIRLMHIENMVETLTRRIFSRQNSRQLDIDASIRQSLRHVIASLDALDDSGETAALRLTEPLGNMQSISGIIVTKYLQGDSLKKQHGISRKLGNSVSYASLCFQVSAAAAVLAVAHQAQLLSVLQADTLHIDRSPRACTLKRGGVVKEIWFWPLHSETGEIHFLFSPSPSISHLEHFLAQYYTGDVTLDEKAAFNSYARSLRSQHTDRKSDDITGKIWKFSGSDIPIESTGIFKSLVASCLLQGLSPSGYLASVMTLIATSSQPLVHALTPRERRGLLCPKTITPAARQHPSASIQPVKNSR